MTISGQRATSGIVRATLSQFQLGNKLTVLLSGICSTPWAGLTFLENSAAFFSLSSTLALSTQASRIFKKYHTQVKPNISQLWGASNHPYPVSPCHKSTRHFNFWPCLISLKATQHLVWHSTPVAYIHISRTLTKFSVSVRLDRRTQRKTR